MSDVTVSKRNLSIAQCAQAGKPVVPSHGSVVYTAPPPPSKRLKSEISILDYLLDDSLTALIFSFVGPQDTAHCTQVCRTWHSTSGQHPSLWKAFVEADFGFTTPTTIAAAATGNPWPTVYAYLARCKQTPAHHLEADVIFADDGGGFPGYPPHHALLPNKNMVWCTSTGADQNVDLVIQLKNVSLVTGFVAANGGRGYSAPLKEGLVFCSMDPPDLDAARVYNVDDQTSTGRIWLQHLFQPKNTQVSERSTGVSQHADNVEGDHDRNTMTEEGEHNRQQPAVTSHLASPSKSTLKLPNVPTKNAPVPSAAFHFPNLAQAYHGESEQTLTKPVVARYIHFKLLRSHSPPGLEHISDNIDVMALHTKGIEIPQIQELVGLPHCTKGIPQYSRQHPIRLPPELLLDGNVGAWLEFDFL